MASFRSGSGGMDGRGGDGRGGDGRKRTFQRRKVCRFCVNKELSIDYKNVKMLTYFTTERGKIIPRRISGNCAKHQRELTQAIKRSRNIALLPFTRRY